MGDALHQVNRIKKTIVNNKDATPLSLQKNYVKNENAIPI
jgi:hypothetical protein